MPRKKKEEELKPIEEPFNYGGLIKLILIIVLIVFSIGKYGAVGNFIHNLFCYLFGSFYIATLICALLFAFVQTFLNRKYKFNIWFYIGLILISLCFILLDGYLSFKEVDSVTINVVLDTLKNTTSIVKTDVDFGCGLLGNLLTYLSFIAFDKAGTLIILVVGFALSLIMIVPLGVYRSIASGVKDSSTRISNELKQQQKVHEEERIIKEHKRQEEIQRLKQEEEERKLELAQMMNSSFKETPNPEHITYSQTEIEEVENTSAFAKTFFIDDKSSQSKKPTSTNVSNEENVPSEKATINKVKLSKGAYHKPPVSLLANISGKPSDVNKKAAQEKGKRLIEILRNFEIEAELINTHIGPSVTKFEVKPSSTVKINRINNIADNIKMELAAKEIRIEAPIPGRNAVGVEIPNVEMVSVRMSELMKQVPSKYNNSPLTFTLGKDLMGKPVYCELNKMPHLLIAGATGSGKSVCMNTIITSFLLRTNPNDLKLVLIDPKKVEFAPYHDIPHLLWPVITDTNVASLMLKKAVVIMEDRYDKFADAGVRDIASFNELVEKHNMSLKSGESPMTRMPYIVIIIDELADLMAIARKDVELSIQRLTQLSRACGMHMIVATQRPSTDVITGLIKSNIPSRISFAVSSSIDSRTILDSVGAEKLLGNGDMLYMPQGENAPNRVQGAFVTDKEINSIAEYAKKEASPEYEDSYFELMRNDNTNAAFDFTGEGGNSSKDSLYDEVVEYVREAQKASTSLLQRKFGIGYNRSARIIDQLEENGVIGPANGSKPREVYLKKENDND